MRETVGPVRAAVEDFRKRQEAYFAQAEEAVVRLSLNIAARILHREAQMDPLILRGAARVALDDAHSGTVCVLEIAEAQRDGWERWIAEQTLPVSVELRILPDAPPGHCRIEIGESRADVSVESQLGEIERGFFDLLQRRTSPEARQ